MSWWVASEAEAVSALRGVGATFVPELTQAATHPTRGPCVRRFGVVLLLPPDGPIRAAVDALLVHPSNRWLRASLDEGRLRHVPVSRRLAQELAATLPPPVHLPWTFQPLNADLAGPLEDWAERVRPSFGTYFVQHVEWADDEVVPRRVFSLPVLGSAEGTLHDAPLVEALDPGVGLLLEVDAAGPAAGG